MFEYRFALLIALLTIGLIVFGGVVHNTESGLACPDWPLCYGEILPDMGDGVIIEMGHRMAAAGVGFLTVLFFVTASVRKRFDRRYRRMAFLSVLFVVIQGAFGALTVVLRLPSFASTAHLAVSIIYLSLLLILVSRARLSLAERHSAEVREDSGKMARWIGILVVLLYLQLLLGAFVRHTGSGAAAGLGPGAAFIGIDPSLGESSFWPIETPGKFNMLHRYFAVFFGIFTLIIGWRMDRIGLKGANRKIRLLAVATMLLVGTQIILGVWSVWSFLGITAVTMHLAVGTLLFATLLSGYLYLKFLAEPYDYRCPAEPADVHETRPVLTMRVPGNEQAAT